MQTKRQTLVWIFMGTAKVEKTDKDLGVLTIP